MLGRRLVIQLDMVFSQCLFDRCVAFQVALQCSLIEGLARAHSLDLVLSDGPGDIGPGLWAGTKRWQDDLVECFLVVPSVGLIQT